MSGGEVLRIDPLTVDPDMGGRIGLYFPAKAIALGALMRADGQNDPIKVMPTRKGGAFEWKLVAGLHRLKGCIHEGIEVLAIAVAPQTARRVQASENLERRELEPLERAMFVAAVAEAARARLAAEHEGLSQQAIAGKARQSKAGKVQFSAAVKADEEAESARLNLSRAYGWRDEVADACGLSLADLKRALRVYRAVIEPNRDLIDRFKDHGAAKKASNLLELARVPTPARLRRAIELMVGSEGEPGLADFDAAMVAAQCWGPKIKAEGFDKWCNQAVSAASRLGGAEWKRFCPQFVSTLSHARQQALREALDDALSNPVVKEA